MYENRQAFIAWDSKLDKSSKYSKVSCHISRETVMKRKASFEYFITAELNADILTKPLASQKFSQHWILIPMKAYPCKMLEKFKIGHPVEVECWTGDSRTLRFMLQRLVLFDGGHDLMQYDLAFHSTNEYTGSQLVSKRLI